MRLLLILFLTGLTANSIHAQKESNPLVPVDYGIRQEIGILLGLGQNFQSGTSYVDCEGCEFEDGTKFGITFGAYYGYYVNESISFGIMGLYDDLGLSSSFIEIESVTPINSNNLEIPVQFRHNSEISLGYISAAPYVKWDVFDFFSLQAGPSVSFNTSSNLKHEKVLLDRTVTLQNGEIVQIELQDYENYTATLQDGEYEGINSIRFALLASAGFDIHISKRADLGASLMYSIPFTLADDKSDDFKIFSWRIMLKFSYALTLSNWEAKNF